MEFKIPKWTPLVIECNTWISLKAPSVSKELLDIVWEHSDLIVKILANIANKSEEYFHNIKTNPDFDELSPTWTVFFETEKDEIVKFVDKQTA